MAPNPSDLVRLADLRAVADPDTDPVLQRQITAVSRSILTAINRPSILPRAYVETYEAGRNGLLLRNWPVTRVDAVSRAGTLVRPLVPGSGLIAGYDVDPDDEVPPGRPQMLRFGHGSPIGFGCARVTVTYTAGYQVTAEATVVPQGGAVIALQPYGAWASDGGVTYAGGSALARVASAPSAGQYAMDGAGGYTFAAADAGRPVALTYGYVPADLANAAREWILERQAYAERVGLQSKSLGGQETVSFRIAAVPDFVAPVLQQYASVVPPC
ncbi:MULTISPECIES: hypothetical protein [Methylobacterium]|uniref:hypothetical protein n=1 Tax=Methylobacterium TaxID=407 RepID=UPI0013E9CF51|nr:hypothetical protein [Methylobacterium sp. DB0501]NGM34515.1 hypothetical protein [Methylobacterium sp. DB0501]